MKQNALELFQTSTANWFRQFLGTPTAVQEEAWPAIASGKSTLVSAPTGTGKTLSAFLVFIDRFNSQTREGTLKQELQLIYISPLKSLAGDIRENLRRPLNGITQFSELQVAIRTGDTTQKERRSMIKTPPHILITTPESLYLMLTSKSGQKILQTAQAIIIDELHALIDSKRGAHLMLSIARLDLLCKKPLQRIGLSATIEPLETAAKYLSPDPVTIVAPTMHKELRIEVTSPLSDQNIKMKNPVWQELSKAIYDKCLSSRSAIAFVEGRAYAEKLAYYINQLGGEGFARTHHGSLSKEQRFEVEHALRDGYLRLLCATSSMELGIDVGDIDQVFQIGCPRSISSTMQRLGRAGHNPNRISVMHMYPRETVEGLYCAMTAQVAKNGGVEDSHPPRLCLDVLAQHLVSMAACDPYTEDEVFTVLSRAYPFRDITKQDIKDVLCMLAGDFEHTRDIPVRPRILYDRIHESVEGDSYSRMLAISAGGTIPDRGLYTAKTENGVKIGELDEEFVFEARIGDRFLLGTFAWQIVQVQKDTVIVREASTAGAKLPFWHGDIKGRRLKTGIAFGSILRKLAIANETGSLLQELLCLGLDSIAAHNTQEFLKRQLKATGILPDDRTILVEHFRDENGNYQMMVHSVFGRQVNDPLVLLIREAAKCHRNTTINCVNDDDGFLLFPYDGKALPMGLLQEIKPETARSILTAILPATPLFNMNFRYNTSRALMMGVRGNGRQPLWVQRLRSAEMLSTVVEQNNHPIVRETKRECLEDYWDLQGVEQILLDIRSGNIKIYELYLDSPSPMSLPLRRQTEASMMYDYAPSTPGIQQAVSDALSQAKMITPEQEQLIKVSIRDHLPENEQQLHTLLMIEGDIIAGELELPVEWLESLARKEQVKYIEPGLWIAAEQEAEYLLAFQEEDTASRMHIVRRLLRYRGAQSSETLEERYLWSQETSEKLLLQLCNANQAIAQDDFYYHAQLYERARKETINNRRSQIRTVPSDRYAALLATRFDIAAPTSEQLKESLRLLSDLSFSPSLWEGILLPARVSNYRPELLDSLLASGSFFWNLSADNGLCFRRYEDIDWDADLTYILEDLEGNEKLIYMELLKRGASFMQRLAPLIGDASPYDDLISLAEKGQVYADSFIPVRQWLDQDKLQKANLKHRINARSKILATGRWEVLRPLRSLSIDEQLDRIFDRVVILSKETIQGQGISWAMALQTLRIWELTGRVRRGYFIKGLSGIQFIQNKEFAGIMLALQQPRDQIVWMSAVDPMQPWGKCLPHRQDRAFMNVIGTVVALRAGVVIAVLERQGKILRVFDFSSLPEVLRIFSQDFTRRRLFPTLNRITVKQYPVEAAAAMSNAGFIHEIQDYVLYRGCI